MEEEEEEEGSAGMQRKDVETELRSSRALGIRSLHMFA